MTKHRQIGDAVIAVIAGAGWALLILPVIVVICVALNSAETLSFPPDGLSLRWLAAALDSPVFMKALMVSAILALVATCFAVVLGVPSALGIMRMAHRGHLMAQLLTAPILIPGLVIGFAIYVFYVSSGLGLNGTFLGLLLGHTVVSTPWVITTVLAAARRLDPAQQEVACSLGAGTFYVFRRVTFPALLPGIVAGAIFAFVTSFSQFDVSLFLGVSDATPLPIALFTSLMNRGEPVIAAAGVLAILVVVTALAVVNFTFSVSALFGGRPSGRS